MDNDRMNDLPHMLYADQDGRVYDHPTFRMAGFSASKPVSLVKKDLIPMPPFSKLFFIPDCPPIGINPETGAAQVVPEIEVDGVRSRCYAVAAFLEPGFVRNHLPGVDYRPKSYTLPMWAYTAVGFRDEDYWVSAFRIEDNPRWDPRNYDDKELVPAIKKFQKRFQRKSGLVNHLIGCATRNHCFAAKNLFFRRWEAPLPVSRRCNAACLGCLSLQPDSSCEASHQRLAFTPSEEEIVDLAVGHLKKAPEAIVSFGQGCEGEPLTEYELIARSIEKIRKQTNRGTINLNTNGSWPDRIQHLAQSGLDSIRISLNSARPKFYHAYYRPKRYRFRDVEAAIALSRKMGLYTMINYLVFPGISDQEEEIEALRDLIRKTDVNFIHLKNLNIDPQLYLEKMPPCLSPAVGMERMVEVIRGAFPNVELGYFNQAVR
jgi:pyruvate-formate lyase-activating enzyme